MAGGAGAAGTTAGGAGAGGTMGGAGAAGTTAGGAGAAGTTAGAAGAAGGSSGSSGTGVTSGTVPFQQFGLSATPSSVSVFADGSFVVGGIQSYSPTFGQGAGAVTLPSTRDGLFLARYTSNGAFVWVEPMTTTGSLNIEGSVHVAALSNGAAAIVGRFKATLTLGRTGKLQTLSCSGAATCGFVGLYGGDGTFKWAYAFEGATNKVASTVVSAVAALADGTFIVAGSYDAGSYFQEADSTALTMSGSGSQQVLMDPKMTATEAFVLKFDTAGAVVWSLRIHGNAVTGGEELPKVRCEAPNCQFAVLSDGTVALSAFANSPYRSERIGFGTGTLTLTACSGDNMYCGIVVAIDPASGTAQWAHAASASITGTSFSFIPTAEISAIGSVGDGLALAVTGEGGGEGSPAMTVNLDPVGTLFTSSDGDKNGNIDWGVGIAKYSSSGAALANVGAILPNGDISPPPYPAEGNPEARATVEFIKGLPDGSFLIGGAMTGQYVFGLGSAQQTAPKSAVPSYPSEQAFVARYDATGALKGVAISGDSSADSTIYDAAPLPGNRVVMVGELNGDFTVGHTDEHFGSILAERPIGGFILITPVDNYPPPPGL
jgi:hypothetical protein